MITMTMLKCTYVNSCLHIVPNSLTQGYDTSGSVNAQRNRVGVHQLIHNGVLQKQTPIKLKN